MAKMCNRGKLQQYEHQLEGEGLRDGADGGGVGPVPDALHSLR